MLPTSDRTAAVIADGNYILHIRASSWLDGVLIADDIPVTSAVLEEDWTLRVQERMLLTVPRYTDGYDWSPGMTAGHPLSADGQRLRIETGIGVEGSEVEWFQRGWFLIQDAQPDGDTVTVTAVGLLALILEAQLVSPFQPSGTLDSTLRALIEPALSVLVDDGLVDRAVPTAINFDDDRLQSVYEVADAWPCELRVDPSGFLHAQPIVAPDTAVLSLTDGVDGTVIRALSASTRDGACNAVVARGRDVNGGQVMGVAYDTSTGPKRLDGPFNPLPVPYFFESPLLTTVAECNAAAAAILERKRTQTATAYEVEMVPNPRLQLNDAVSITTATATDVLCTVESHAAPLAAGGGDHRVRLRTVIV